MQGVTSKPKKPVLFNKKLFPLMWRYFTFSGGFIQQFSFWLLFLVFPLMLGFYPHIVIAFFFMTILSNLVIAGRYGVSETTIISFFPISKKQSVLARCLHIFLVQSLIISTTIIVAHFLPQSALEDSNTFFSMNRMLAVSVLILSIVIMDAILLRTYFKSETTKKKPSMLLLGVLALFALPVLAPLLLTKSDYLLKNVTNNLNIAPIILAVTLAVFVLSMTILTILTVKNCSLYEAEAQASDEKPDDTPLSQQKPDKPVLALYLKLLRLFKVKEGVIKLIRKDCVLTYPGVYFVIMLFTHTLSYIPVINVIPFIIYASILTIVHTILFAFTGDLKTSYFLPIERTDYIKSKIIHSFFLQTAFIFSIFIICLITMQFGLMPNLFVEERGLEFFGIVFASHGIMCLVFYSLVFKYPFKVRTYLLTTIILLLQIALLASLPAIENFLLSIALVFCGFAVFGLCLLLAYFIAKNKRTDL